MEEKELKKWREAGRIASLIMAYARTLVKPDADMLEITKKIEEKISDYKVKSAFPINISCNEIAAHFTPKYDENSKLNGLVKIDLGISIDGCISDIAQSFDLTPEKRHSVLIKASEEALKNAIKIIKPGVEVWQIGKVIQEAISSYNFSPIRNLSGHELKPYFLHAGLTVPNYNNENKTKLQEGQIIAIEPFATTGEGIVIDGKHSEIYHLIERKPIRETMARKILDFIEKEYKNLPFASRWIVDKFGSRALFSLRLLEQAEILHHFPQLVEKTKHPVSQAEHTVLVTKNGCEVLTE